MITPGVAYARRSDNDLGRKKAKITVITMLIFVLIVISIVVVDFLLVKDKLKEE